MITMLVAAKVRGLMAGTTGNAGISSLSRAVATGKKSYRPVRISSMLWVACASPNNQKRRAEMLPFVSLS